MKRKPKYDDTDINQAIWLLQQNGFNVDRVWFNKEHRLRSYVTAKEVKKACEWLKDNQSGCVHYDMFRFGGMTYSIVFGVWGDEGDPGIYRKIARQPVDSALQCDFEVDWNMPLWLDKDGKATGDVWDSMDRIGPVGMPVGGNSGVDMAIWRVNASTANEWILDVYEKVIGGEMR